MTTISETFKERVEGVGIGAVVSYDNPFNIENAEAKVWVMPPVFPVDGRVLITNDDYCFDNTQPIIVDLEVRVLDLSGFVDLITLFEDTLGIEVFGMTEQYLPAGSLGVINQSGYLYKFKCKFQPALLSD